MKTGFKRTLVALAMLFGSALLLASVHAQSSFTHSNNLIPNSLTAFSIPGSTLNFLAPVPDDTCPKKVAAHGDTVNDDGSRGTTDDYAERDCNNNVSGSEDDEDDRGRMCKGQVKELNFVTNSEVEEKGKCEREDGTEDDFDKLIVKKVPLAPNTYVLTMTSPTGSVSRIAGTMIDGYVQLVP